MMDGWARNFDMSGVSFDQRMTATLVTRRHVVMAKHFKRKPGDRVVFHNRFGKQLERKLVAVKAAHGDIAVGLLDSEVSPDYTVYPLPSPRVDFSHLVGRTAVVTDQHRRIYFHRVNFVSPYIMGFRHQEPKQNGWGKKLVGGDSGNPSFLISGNELVLVETHTSGGAGAGPFYGGAEIQDKLQAVIDDLAPGYRLRRKAL